MPPIDLRLQPKIKYKPKLVPKSTEVQNHLDQYQHNLYILMGPKKPKLGKQVQHEIIEWQTIFQSTSFNYSEYC